MANESARGLTRVEVPEAECMVPGRREGELAVRRDDDVRDKMVVATKNALGITV